MKVSWLVSNLHEHVTRKQTVQKIQHDKHAVDRDISVGDDVFVRNFSLHGGKWLPGLVVECTGPLSYKVETATHGIVRRHQDQVRHLFTFTLKIRYLIRLSMRIRLHHRDIDVGLCQSIVILKTILFKSRLPPLLSKE